MGQVHLDGAGGDEQPAGDGVVAQAYADQADDLPFGRGQAGPAHGGSFTAAALAGGIGHRVVESKSRAFFPRRREAVLAEDVPGLADGAPGGAAVGGEAGCQVEQRPAGRFGGGEQACGVGEAFAGCGEHAEQLDAVAGVHPVATAVPGHGGLAGQVLGIGKPALVPGHDAIGVAERGRGDRLAAPAERGARLAGGGGRRGVVTGDGGQARQGGQGGGHEHDDRDAAPAVSRPAKRGDGGSSVLPGGGEASLGQRAEEFDQPDGAASSRGPAQSDLHLGCFELAQGGEQPGPPVARDRFGEAVRMRRQQATAAGFAGRTRSFPGQEERARVAVGKAIRRAMVRITQADPVIGEHLRQAVHTGVRCSYWPS